MTAEPRSSMMPMPVATAAIESAATSATAIGASATITATISAATAIPAAATEGPLEAGTSATANTSGVARREFLARAGMRSASLSREEYFFCSPRGRNFRGLGFVIVVFVMIVFVVFVIFFVAFFAILFELLMRRLVVFELDMVSEGGDVKCVFVGRIGFRFGDSLWGAYDFLYRGLVSFIFLFVRLVRSRKLFFVFFFDFVFFEHGAASGSVGVSFHNFADFVLFGVNKTGGKRGTLFVAQLDAVFGFVGDGLCFLERFDFFAVQIRFFRCKGFCVFARDFCGFRARSG